MSVAPVVGLDRETLDFTLEAIREFAARHLPDERLLELDHLDECPVDTVRLMCGEELGIQLVFVPEEYGGMGASAFDVYRVCEAMAGIDLGVATSVLATFLGTDPITVGATEEQKARWLGEVAEDGALYAYGATEPEAGSDLGSLRTKATPIMDGEVVTGYRITGRKQWISNGGVADGYTILANAPGGPTWFVVKRGAEGFTQASPEDKHGIRLSNTAALVLEDVEVGADALVGEVEGQGLWQAQQVFGYTRLNVATFGLGAGWAALDRAITYSTTRIQAGGPLSEKQGYTHKLIVPHAVRLEASRAYIEETAERIDAGEGSLNTEGAIAKYLATESANAAADASIQAMGGYGYTREYLVEKIKRDVRITTIYEGTSEIMEMTIGRDRWQQHLKTQGAYYRDAALALERLHASAPEVGADVAALGLHALGGLLEWARVGRLTRNQHILFRLGELIAYAEPAASFARRAARAAAGTLSDKAERGFDAEGLATLSRVFAREAAERVATEGMRLVVGAGGADPAHLPQLAQALRVSEIQAAQVGLIPDMDAAVAAVYRRAEHGHHA
jgi:alkylation response protein AidB-like acyl-CoA dehydrogenase